MRHLVDWTDVGGDVWEECLRRTLEFALDRSRGGASLAGRNLGLVFFNDSLRTRVSMELAVQELGGRTVTVTPGSGTWGFEWSTGTPMTGAAAEHIKEAVGVLGRYVDALGVRLFASGTDYQADRTDARFRLLTELSSVPVLNLESAWAHPCQALADAGALMKTFGARPAGRKFVLSWASHPKALPMAVPNSALRMAARTGMDVTVARPESHALHADVMADARRLASAAGGSVTETDDLDSAVEDAHVVYAKSWGGPMMYDDPDGEHALRTSLTDWRITADRMARTDEGRFMHCLPVRRGVVVDDAVIDDPSAIHLDQAEFRIHAQKAILTWLLGADA